MSDLHPTAIPTGTSRIGMFDSGVGGLSLLGALRASLPGSQIRYLADSAHAPYGERDDGFILERSLRLAESLYAAGAQVLVVACNTATAVAIDALRRRYPQWPVVGIEPGLRPALARTASGRIGIMATTATLRSARWRALVAREAGTRPMHAQACPGLAAAIEAHDPGEPWLVAEVERHGATMRAAGVDVVVLGCTHYPFVRTEIGRALGEGVTVIDTSEAVAAQVARVLGCDVARHPGSRPGPIPLLQTTGDAARLQRFAARWLPFDVEVGPAPRGL